MKTGLILKLAFLIVALLVSSSQGFFFESPKKAIWEFFQSWKEKKEAKKKPPAPNIRHYHVHYYPAQIHVISGISAKAPDKYELDALHDEKLSSLGWSDYEYKYVPEPRVSISSSLSDLWNDVKYPFSPWGPGYIEADVSESVDRTEHQGILVQLPVHPQIIIEHPHAKKKTSLLAAFFHKTGHTKRSAEA